MSSGFSDIIAASDADRRDLFLTTSLRLGTPIQNIEKDFWVCWVLDLLFNSTVPGEPRLVFKGGTSLSKGHGLISRFSEDIDVTIFRADLGQAVEINQLELLSGKKQRSKLSEIKRASQQYIAGMLRARLTESISKVFEKIGERSRIPFVTLDPHDSDGQTLLVAYPAVSSQADDYNPPMVKIEAGAKSALAPSRAKVITPYLAKELPSLALEVPNVTTIDAERMFWDKIIILHGQRRWFERRGSLRREGQRVSRHYYDVYHLLQSEVGRNAARDFDLANHCTSHARMFFNSSDLGLSSAQPGTFSLSPLSQMNAQLMKDYDAMSGMIFGESPKWDEIVETIRQFESEINGPSHDKTGAQQSECTPPL